MSGAASLYHDILWNIFDIIASTKDETGWQWRSGRSDEPPSHRVLRDASHTCAAWRNTLLSSPSLWGKCLTFDELFSSGEAWRLEVIRRSGDAPLYVTRLSEDTYPDEVEDWLMATFIKSNWNQIRSLNIIVWARLLETYLEIQSLPPANLVSCKCFFYGKDDDGSRHEYPQKQYYAIAMGEGAPCLRTLDISSKELYPLVLNINISAEPQRLSQLRELQINPAHEKKKKKKSRP
ncbi:hypothetical protein D9613_006537 [Agrocybe pediades]|uniref:F-box domain-containing protein n=1 Tax=Agrocybe pediades TaxID=84607 RepID=A0A8H4VKC6_9AGAR|nr:hypothetical protein D9613_006537 [Agrocybe pediades]